MSHSARVGIVILNYNGLRDTLNCLDSLKRLTYRNYEIILVDQASVGNDVETFRRQSDDRMIVIANDENHGFAEGNNIGIRLALERAMDYVLLLNNDTEVEPDFLARLLVVAESNEAIGIVTPAIHDFDPPQAQRYPRRVDRWHPMLHFHFGSSIFVALGGRRPLWRTGSVNHSDGCAMLIRTEVLKAIGLLDPIYFFGGYEDFDLSVRTLRCGYKIMSVTDAKVYHKSRRSWSSPLEASLAWARLNPRNRILYARKNLTTGHFLLFLLLLPTQLISWVIAESLRGGGPRVIAAVFRGMWEGFTVPIQRGGLDGV